MMGDELPTDEDKEAPLHILLVVEDDEDIGMFLTDALQDKAIDTLLAKRTG